MIIDDDDDDDDDDTSVSLVIMLWCLCVFCNPDGSTTPAPPKSELTALILHLFVNTDDFI